MNETLAAVCAVFALLSAPVHADENPVVVDAPSGDLDFAEYGSSLIWPEQIPADDWKKLFIVDARDAAQFEKEHIPGAVNIEWRQAAARRGELPKDRMAVVYCNSGSLSAQAAFALRVLGHDNVKACGTASKAGKPRAASTPAPARRPCTEHVGSRPRADGCRFDRSCRARWNGRGGSTG